MNNRERLLKKANELVNGDRNRQYGDPNSDFAKTAALWETYLNGVHERQMTQLQDLGLDTDAIDITHTVMVEPQDVAAMMILLKISRLTWSPDKEDHWADIAGYAACGWDCVAEDPLDDDEEFQNDIAVDMDVSEEDGKAFFDFLMSLLPKEDTPKFGGFLGASLFPKDKDSE